METEHESALGALLVRTRKSAELTQEALAERAGISANTISNLEAGRGYVPRQSTLDLLVGALAAALALDTVARAELRSAFRAAVSHDRSPRAAPLTAPEPSAISSSPPLPSGVVTFLACRPLLAALPEAQQAHAWQQISVWLTGLLDQSVSRHAGRLMDPPENSDGAVCIFLDAVGAVTVACALQQALWDGSGARVPAIVDPATGAVPVCLAVHTGWSEPGAGGHYAGPTLRRTVRLARLGHGGQLLLTASSREAVRAGLPDGARLQALGRHSLSPVERPQALDQVIPASLSGTFPSLRLPQMPPTNLPVHPASFVGRERDQGAVETLLGQTSLVTLVGAGGCGKTRLALAVAADLLEDHPEGAWLVELEALRDPDLVPQAVAGALGLREWPDRPLPATILEHLGAARLLLVLDNCEHLLPACAELASAVLRRCPGVQLLATSRERLAIGGESTYRVPSLGLPAPGAANSPAVLQEYDAVRLFVERARARRSDFALRDENAAVVVQICRRLDGMPLAIELAAAQVGSLPLEVTASRLADSLAVLTGGPRDALPRQQTLRATLDWSWGLLAEPEQLLLQRLSVFAGGCSMDAVARVCAGLGIAERTAPQLLDTLIEKSLVGLDESSIAARCSLLESVRQFAAEHLAVAGEAVAMRDRHLAWAVDLAETAAPGLSGPD